ncbi:MAG TPA: HAMP domain-containing sensor histidine kinase [Paracoccaceae bacterium]|nr:HAMP domain-containing sensor histidine kinase [Paracoccaceae bacterium]
MASEHREPDRLRRRAPLVARLVAALVALILLLAGLGGFTVWGLQHARLEVRRAEESLRQLENVRAIEAAFNLYLLGEIGRRLLGDASARESPAAGALRGTLLVFRSAIAAEIAGAATEAERAEERAELVRANALTAIFETIETESRIDRAAGSGAAEESARRFLDRIAAGRDAAFRSVTFEVLQDESAEAGGAFAGLDRLRADLVRGWSALAGAFVLGASAFVLVFHRSMMRPIRALTAAAEAFGSGEAAVRVAEDLPGEFAMLGRRFNAMAARIETEQQRLQEEVAARTADLAAANAELTRIDRSRRRFFANVSHELRTPLTVLLGEAQVALRGHGGEREALERIAANGGFLRRRLNDLLRLARSIDGELALTMAPADLAAAVREAAETARAFAAANDIALVVEAAAPVAVRGDAEALRQAALALIDNAIKFSPPGSKVSIRVENRSFRVADRGPGFGATDPAALFERYAQDEEGRSAGGAGLGLAIVKWIADEHGAKVIAADRPGGGAEVGLEFP